MRWLDLNSRHSDSSSNELTNEYDIEDCYVNMLKYCF